MNGRVQTRLGNRHAWMAPHGLYRCRGDDRWVAIAVESDEQWGALCTAIGRPELASDERFATQAQRHEHQDELDALIEAWTVERDERAAQDELQAAGVPAGAVLDVAGVYEDPQLKHRETITFADHPETGPFPHTRTAWRSRRGNSGVNGPAPLYGDATDRVLRELLSLDDDEVERLIADGVVAREPAPRN
jgi:crotonobetainyl-CoA:carnitine CoA-transferase CaiB-like acyl-CoA transferase